MRAVLILNPTSGSSMMATNQNHPAEEIEATILASLRAQGVEPEVWYTTEEDPGHDMAERAAQEGAEMVIAAGGDGTLHAVASGLIGTQSALGIIPRGTMNNIACSLEIPEDIEEACKIIAEGATCQIDIGKINGHIFLEVAGVGLEAALFPAAEEIKSSHWLSTIHGVIEGLRTLFAFQPTRFTISFDGRRTRHYHAIQISVCNTPYYGARFQFAPRAVMNDGLLDVLIYKNFSKIAYLRHAISISEGRRALEPRVMRRKIKTLRISTTTPIEIHADGVPIGQTPATITIVPAVLQVRVPQKIATGPNIANRERQRTEHYQRAKSSEPLHEKGPLYVK
ncbi:MAG TPA: diacylglycerol kinase family protein [Ktedonosporobacter sp.]|nr:diacylglycerol kinase family protein [Ktedonosporobacter sp.]